MEILKWTRKQDVVLDFSNIESVSQWYVTIYFDRFHSAKYKSDTIVECFPRVDIETVTKYVDTSTSLRAIRVRREWCGIATLSWPSLYSQINCSCRLIGQYHLSKCQKLWESFCLEPQPQTPRYSDEKLGDQHSPFPWWTECAVSFTTYREVTEFCDPILCESCSNSWLRMIRCLADISARRWSGIRI